MNIAGMARKSPALLLMISWFGLAGFDVLEDLDLPDRFELYSSSADLLPDPGQLQNPPTTLSIPRVIRDFAISVSWSGRPPQLLIGWLYDIPATDIQASQLRRAFSSIGIAQSGIFKSLRTASAE
jgi:hypothetical protein